MLQGLIKEKRISIIWNLAWPLMVSQILQTLLQIVDMWFIGNLRITEAIAATGFSTSVLGVIIMFSQLIATGGIALISRKTGEDDREATVKITEHALVLAFLIGLIIAIVCFVFSEKIISLFNAEKVVSEYAVLYLKFVLISVPFTFFNLTARAILQATGDSKNPMLIFGLMNIINIVLDAVLIYGIFSFKGLGFNGAALATSISNIVAFMFMFNVINKKLLNGNFTKIIKNFKLSIDTMSRILKIGFFSAIQAVSRPFTGLLMFKIANYSGTDAVAAFTVGGRMFNFVFIFLTGLNMAVSVLVGQNLGKKNIKEAEDIVKDGVKLAIINMIVFAIPYFIFAKYLMLFFVKDDMAVVNIGVNYLRITYAGIITVAYTIVYGGAFIGAGNTAPPMIASLVANWIFKLPLAYILSYTIGIGANGVWIAISLSVVVESAILWHWFRKGKWKYNKI